MDSLLKDIRYGYRTLLRNPGFTGVAVLSLALGIGANTAIFSFINTVLLKTLPVRAPQELVLFGPGTSRGMSGGPPDGPMSLFSWRQFHDFRQHKDSFSDLLGVDSMPVRAYLKIDSGAPELTQASLVSGNFFTFLGIQPAAGRLFDTSMDSPTGASAFIVLNDGYWRRRFHRDPRVLGQTMRLGDRSYTVIGVAQAGFFGVQPGESPDIWIPVSMQDQLPGAFAALNDPLAHFLLLIGRLKPGIDLKHAEANLNVVLQQNLPEYLRESPAASGEDAASSKRARIEMTPADRGISRLRRQFELPLRVLMAVVAFVLLIACANVANLLVALASRRQKEIALRVAIGAGRGRVIRQLLTESVLLSGAGGALGILLASGAGKILVHLISTGPQSLPLDFDLDGRVLAFTIIISLLTGVLFGLAPALRASRVDLNSSLKETKGSMASPRKVTFGRAMVVGQVALSLALLITAGLLVRSFRNLTAIATGFDRQNVLIFKLDTESSGYKPDAQLASLYRAIEQRVAGLPGVAAGGVSFQSFSGGQRAESFTAPGVHLAKAQSVTAMNFVTPGYFGTMRLAVIVGRAIQATDSAAALPIVVVSETFAQDVFGTMNVIGKTVKLDEKSTAMQIVGVVRDAKYQDLREERTKMIYVPVDQNPAYLHDLAVRVHGDPSSVAASVRSTIRSIEPNLPIRWTTTLADEVSDSLVKERAVAQLSSFFAGLALVLSAIGLYGTISFAAARRTNEIGIRMALGAERTGVVGMVLKDAMTLTGAGMLIGLPLAFAASAGLKSMLYGLTAMDWASALVAVGALSVVAAVAGYLPARRAARVDPVVALRYE